MPKIIGWASESTIKAEANNTSMLDQVKIYR